MDGFARGDGQDDAGVLDLEVSQVPGSCDGLEDGEIRVGDAQRARIPSTHGTTSNAGAGLNLYHTATPNLLHYLWPGTLADVNTGWPFGHRRAGSERDMAMAEYRIAAAAE